VTTAANKHLSTGAWQNSTHGWMIAAYSKGTGRKRTEIRDMLDVLNMNFNEDAFADELFASFKQKKENEINRIKARSFAGFRQAGAISSSGCQIKVCVEITAQQMDSQQYFWKS